MAAVDGGLFVLLVEVECLYLRHLSVEVGELWRRQCLQIRPHAAAGLFTSLVLKGQIYEGCLVKSVLNENPNSNGITPFVVLSENYDSEFGFLVLIENRN